MSSQETLGRTFNLITSATTTATRVNLQNCAGVSFVLTGATSGNATIQEASAASGGTAQNLAAITRYYTWSATTGLWTKVTQAAAATFTATTGGLAYAFIPQGALTDGFKYLTASHATGSFLYIMGDLDVQRAPASLSSVLS